SQAEIEAVIAYIKSFWTEEQRLIQAERTLQKMNQ
ncbi:MAG: cytochrome C, partial [Phototrophicales bacterium]